MVTICAQDFGCERYAKEGIVEEKEDNHEQQAGDLKHMKQRAKE
jgi:hypothetical protein